MSTDAGQPIARPDDHRDIWRLPKVLAARTVRRRLPEPRRITIRGEDHYIEEAVEIEIEVSEPFEIRALGPALWVGGEQLTIAEQSGPTTYRFLVLRPEAIPEGAAIELAWNSSKAPRIDTNFRYEPPPAPEAPGSPMTPTLPMSPTS